MNCGTKNSRIRYRADISTARNICAPWIHDNPVDTLCRIRDHQINWIKNHRQKIQMVEKRSKNKLEAAFSISETRFNDQLPDTQCSHRLPIKRPYFQKITHHTCEEFEKKYRGNSKKRMESLK